MLLIAASFYTSQDDCTLLSFYLKNESWFWFIDIVFVYFLTVLSTSMAKTRFSFNSCCRSPLKWAVGLLLSYKALECWFVHLSFSWSLCKQTATCMHLFCFLFRFKAQEKGKHSGTLIMPLHWETQYCFCGTIKTWGHKLYSLINQIMVLWALLEIPLSWFTYLPWTQLSALTTLVAVSITTCLKIFWNIFQHPLSLCSWVCLLNDRYGCQGLHLRCRATD